MRVCDASVATITGSSICCTPGRPSKHGVENTTMSDRRWLRVAGHLPPMPNIWRKLRDSNPGTLNLPATQRGGVDGCVARSWRVTARRPAAASFVGDNGPVSWSISLFALPNGPNPCGAWQVLSLPRRSCATADRRGPKLRSVSLRLTWVRSAVQHNLRHVSQAQLLGNLVDHLIGPDGGFNRDAQLSPSR